MNAIILICFCCFCYCYWLPVLNSSRADMTWEWWTFFLSFIIKIWEQLNMWYKNVTLHSSFELCFYFPCLVSILYITLNLYVFCLVLKFKHLNSVSSNAVNLDLQIWDDLGREVIAENLFQINCLVSGNSLICGNFDTLIDLL